MATGHCDTAVASLEGQYYTAIAAIKAAAVSLKPKLSFLKPSGAVVSLEMQQFIMTVPIVRPSGHKVHKWSIHIGT